jgi:uncharacterized membrane protein
MNDSEQERIEQLQQKLDVLKEKQAAFSKEMDALQLELIKLQFPVQGKRDKSILPPPTFIPAAEKEESIREESKGDVFSFQDPMKSRTVTPPTTLKPKTPSIQIDWEKFIGENLINKIGIVITILGVGIGAKYSIDNELISPLTRIILGYLLGLVLLGVGIRLKQRYENFSAVLVSGAMAIMYLLTFTAYELYGLLPQVLTFGLMVLFTIFTVIAALHYQRQVIAHIGLVGAYGIPFLLSDGSGNVAILFAYMAIINTGILVIAFNKSWKRLYFVSFAFTWVIYFSWFANSYRIEEHFGLALAGATVFFILFYSTFLAYKLIQHQSYAANDSLLVLLNSFVFYGIGYAILDGHPQGNQLLGVFTIVNGGVHFLVSVLIYRKQLADASTKQLVSGLVLVFISLAIPVQLDGNWVTLLWAGEALLLFWLGRTKQVSFYEKFSNILMVLAFFSILDDWRDGYYAYNPEDVTTRVSPLLHVGFLSSALFVAAFGWIYWLYLKTRSNLGESPTWTIGRLMDFLIPGVLLFSLYYTFRMEIMVYWNQLYTDSVVKIDGSEQGYWNSYWNDDLYRFRITWVLNYSLVFVSILAFMHLRFFKNPAFGLLNLVLIITCIAVFLTQGLYKLSELRESYLTQTNTDFYTRGSINLWLRYLSFALVGIALVASHQLIKGIHLPKKYGSAFDFFLHTTILWVLSSELIHWMDIYQPDQSYKLGLSILWGAYSLFLIILGIWKKNKPIRIGAIVLFALTLVKLFAYDISHLDTIAKTIVFVSLGILLLIISFLYTKFQSSIATYENKN